MNKFLKDALDIQEEIISNRRRLHQNPEIGFELPETLNFVKNELKSYGLEPEECGRSGIEVTIGKGEPVFLLRADMDALPMEEQTCVEYTSKNKFTHSCGHDAHTAMLLATAKILKNREEELNGTVKLMFQPAEELLKGALDMLQNGILENPKVNGALAQHVMSGEDDNKIGHVYISKGEVSTSADAYRIIVNGKQSHGSTPEKGIDAVIIACHIAIGLQNILAREISSDESCVLLVGKILGGATVNTTAGRAELEVSIRTRKESVREFVNKRMKEIAEGISNTYRASVEIIHTMQAPSVYNDEKLVDEVISSIEQVINKEKIHVVNAMKGTEDFAYISQKVPSVFVQIGAGSPDEGYKFNNHNPQFNIDESILAKGVAIYCQVALDYLNKNSI
ncbi:M20 metallopeptidase family protein [Peptoniphilus indolicus]|uniref:M20/M25/M40 family peptidase n=2 Tax=Peptoniphilus indolicus TaxID=33030 RepID=G4D2N2_9FIRM|nr:M20 family metallopeptidase [Peptoniphilus indolicus]EGY80215.1 M20/M25/M40 family peptidase [Peptoniphilus indolicus ATCC 29427]SUB75254.1 Uncharacterized hydrolase YxeP [Peptoniphilus indolicus]